MNCPDADRGAADFRAGTKDAALYNDAVNGADYRRGWQLARLTARDDDRLSGFEHAGQTPVAEVKPEHAPILPREAAPPIGASPVYEPVPVVRTREGAPNQWTGQDVKLRSGEERPKKKARPAAPTPQLGLFQ